MDTEMDTVMEREKAACFTHSLLQDVMGKRPKDLQVVVGDRTFDCHADILIATSEYFRGALSVDMIERKTKTVKILEDKHIGITSDNFCIIKKIIYHGTRDILLDMVLSSYLPRLILMANYLQMPPVLNYLKNYAQKNLNELSQQCITELAALSTEGLAEFKQMAVGAIVQNFESFFRPDDDSDRNNCDLETFLMILTSDDIHVQESTLLETAVDWMDFGGKERWEHAGKVLRHIRYGCLKPEVIDSILLTSTVKNFRNDGDGLNYVKGILQKEEGFDGFTEVDPTRRKNQLVMETSLDTQVFVALTRDESTIHGHMWDENNQEWIENGFRIHNCISNIVVRKVPVTGEKSLIFITSDFVLWELKHGRPYPSKVPLGEMPEVMTFTYRRSPNPRIHLHYCGEPFDSSVLLEAADNDCLYYDHLYLQWHQQVIKYDFQTSRFSIRRDLPEAGQYMLHVEKSINVLRNGSCWLSFGHSSRSFTMTYLDNERQNMSASGEGPPLYEKLWTPFVSLPRSHEDVSSVFILNLTDGRVKRVDMEGNSLFGPRGARLSLKQVGDLEASQQYPAPKFLTKRGLAVCVGNGKVYTVYHDCLLDTGIACDGTTIPEIPLAHLRKNPAYAERNSGIVPPADIQTVLVLPLGLCRNINVPLRSTPRDMMFITYN